MPNFIFISPHFPHTYWEFCLRLKQNGVRVLGIADAPYDELSGELREALTEYYRVDSLDDYDQVYRAVAYLTFKYGRIRLICVDSIDRETWSDVNGDEERRIRLHEQWYHYIIDELLPAVRRYDGETFMVTGCSMGGYHAGNFFFRRPDLFDTLLALSGLYHADFFFPHYTHPLVYDNSPYDFLQQLPEEHPYMDFYRRRRIVMCVGQGAWEDDLLESTRKMDALLRAKRIPAWVDYWGHDVSHDWCWWRKQVVYFMQKLVDEETVDYAI